MNFHMAVDICLPITIHSSYSLPKVTLAAILLPCSETSLALSDAQEAFLYISVLSESVTYRVVVRRFSYF